MAQKETLSSLIHGNFAKELSISQGKMPPNAIDFEKLVIGTFLIDKKGLDYSIDLLKPEVFYDPRHQEIFRAILKLYENNHPVDLMTVIQELKRTDKLGFAGGDHYIIDLTMGVSSSAHIECPSYFREVYSAIPYQRFCQCNRQFIQRINRRF
jgi:replicative DNA helicase